MQPIKKYKVPSRSKIGSFRMVFEFKDGFYECDCPARIKECWHVRRVKQWKNEIQGNPEKCFYSGDTRRLEEHHLLRAADRQLSLTIYLTQWIHRMATDSREFEHHITKIFIEIMEKPQPFNVIATLKEITIKNLASNDKGIRMTLYSEDMEALAFGRLDEKEMVKIEFGPKNEYKLYALVLSVKKDVRKREKNLDRVEIFLEAAPGEVVNAVRLGVTDSKEALITYGKI